MCANREHKRGTAEPEKVDGTSAEGALPPCPAPSKEGEALHFPPGERNRGKLSLSRCDLELLHGLAEHHASAVAAGAWKRVILTVAKVNGSRMIEI